MANELTLKVFMKFAPGTIQPPQVAPSSFQIDVTGTDYTMATQNIGTSAEAVAQGDVGTPGYILVHNLDSTNFVEFGYDDSGFKPTVEVPATGWALFKVSTSAATLQAKADTAAVNIEYFLVEE